MISEIAALLATIILIGLTIFQIALILKYPLGEYAWGGQNKILSNNLRIASVSSIIIYFIIIAIILHRSELVNLEVSENINRHAIWILTAYFALGVFVNGISRSLKERRIMTPVALSLCILCLLVGISTM